MRSIQQEVRVQYRYPVLFTRDLFNTTNTALRDVIAAGGDRLPREVLFVLDRGMYLHHMGLITAILRYCHHHRDVIRLAAPPLLVEGGEGVKNDPRHVQALQEAIHEHGICRHSYLVAIGGGAVLDMAGFAAATAHRGVRLIRVPTTVLAQDDSGVGVKNGINAFDKKNFLGAFAPPFAVLNDSSFLTTLDDRDWRAGVAEAVKVALIKDAAFFDYLEAKAGRIAARDLAVMEEVVYRCAQLHLAHIAGSGDPFESGSSRPLDFGHWAAHKLEQLTRYELRHGEAVAIGLALDSTYSYLSGLLLERDWRRILETLTALGFRLFVPELQSHLGVPGRSDSLFHGLTEFREHLGGELTIMLLEAIGRGTEVHRMDLGLLTECIALLERYQTTGDGSWHSTKALAL